MQDEDYIVFVFDFADKFLTLDGDVLLFHLGDPRIFKEIRLDLDNYNFHICMKWANVNSLPLAIVEDPSMKVWVQPIFPSIPS
jgi:hypothetical protein